MKSKWVPKGLRMVEASRLFSRKQKAAPDLPTSTMRKQEKTSCREDSWELRHLQQDLHAGDMLDAFPRGIAGKLHTISVCDLNGALGENLADATLTFVQCFTLRQKCWSYQSFCQSTAVDIFSSWGLRHREWSTPGKKKCDMYLHDYVVFVHTNLILIIMTSQALPFFERLLD